MAVGHTSDCRSHHRLLLLIALLVVSQIVTFVWLSSSSTSGVLLLRQHSNEMDVANRMILHSPNRSFDWPWMPTGTTGRNPLSDRGVDPDATCDDLMYHFHRVNQAFRQEDPTASPPLINYGFYQGQGFGRLVDQSVSHCLLSLALDRPCLIDLSDRDPFYTWRAFIHTGTYDWELDRSSAIRYSSEHRARLEDLATSVRAAIARLPTQGAGSWDDPIPRSRSLYLMQKLEWSNRRTFRQRYWEHIRPWRVEHIPKALLSPNWGDAWHPNLQPPAYYGKCHRKELVTRIQNAMYQPTPLSVKLHTQQRYKVMKNPLRPYGAIHIRFVILHMQKTISNDNDLATALGHCLQYAKDRTNLTDWWLISDKPSRGIDLVNQVTSQMDGLRLYYAPENKNAVEFAEHSNNDVARGKFGHASMSVSIMDWMVLHESEAAIVTQGSYGDTGARGKGKVPDDAENGRQCGFLSLYFSEK